MADFYTDNNIAVRVAGLLRSSGHSVLAARDVDLESAKDDEHLLVAAQSGRILVTNNEADFILLHDAWQRWTAAWGVAERHSGIMIVPQGKRYGLNWDARQIADELVTCLATCSPVSNALLWRKEAGWLRQHGTGWIPCA